MACNRLFSTVKWPMMTKETCMEVDRLKIADAVQNKFDVNELKVYSRKYIWWKSPDDAISCPQRVIAQVMNVGDYEDVQKLANQIGDEALRNALLQAQPGQFNERSWSYWHYRLGLASHPNLPPLPIRTLA